MLLRSGKNLQSSYKVHLYIQEKNVKKRVLNKRYEIYFKRIFHNMTKNYKIN